LKTVYIINQIRKIIFGLSISFLAAGCTNDLRGASRAVSDSNEISYFVESISRGGNNLTIEVSYTGVCNNIVPKIEKTDRNVYQVKILGDLDGCKSIGYHEFKINLDSVCKNNKGVMFLFGQKGHSVECP